MARSLKKGPFADEHLLKKIDALNASNKKEVAGSAGDQGAGSILAPGGCWSSQRMEGCAMYLENRIQTSISRRNKESNVRDRKERHPRHHARERVVLSS